MNLWKLAIAEAMGTFCLVFAGTGAIVSNQVALGEVTHVGIALTFGLVVMAMIYSIGDVSGAHLNPAVTMAFAVAGRFSWTRVLPYILAQVVGACLASGLLRVLFWDVDDLGVTRPHDFVSQAFVFEVVLTAILMYVILNVSTGAQEKGIMAGAAIGATVALEALFAGPISGASMNPARSLAPAIFSHDVEHLWIYLIACPLGAVLAVPMCQCSRNGDCCNSEQAQ